MRAVSAHPDVLVVTSSFWQLNAIALRAPTATQRSGHGPLLAHYESMLIDSPYFPEELEALPGLLAGAGFEPDALLATHADFDHVLGRLAFPGLALGLGEPSVERIHRDPGEAQRSLRDYDERFYVERPRPLALGQVQALPVPGSVELGSEELELHPADGHVADGVAVLARWCGVLCVGDYLSDVEIDPHAFPSEMLGESQRAITRLMMDTVPELAARRPHTVVLVDEVESLAVRRSAASFETNPVDVHRATDALLAGIDSVAQDYPGVLFVTTTNFPEAIDEAFLSRADLVLHVPLPDEATIATILRNSLRELAGIWPELRPLAEDEELLADLAKRCSGWDGRRLRKTVLAALSQRIDVALDPAQLTADDLLAAVDGAA